MTKTNIPHLSKCGICLIFNILNFKSWLKILLDKLLRKQVTTKSFVVHPNKLMKLRILTLSI